jgi:hypothetical protein
MIEAIFHPLFLDVSSSSNRRQAAPVCSLAGRRLRKRKTSYVGERTTASTESSGRRLRPGKVAYYDAQSAFGTEVGRAQRSMNAKAGGAS